MENGRRVWRLLVRAVPSRTFHGCACRPAHWLERLIKGTEHAWTPILSKRYLKKCGPIESNSLTLCHFLCRTIKHPSSLHEFRNSMLHHHQLALQHSLPGCYIMFVLVLYLRAPDCSWPVRCRYSLVQLRKISKRSLSVNQNQGGGNIQSMVGLSLHGNIQCKLNFNPLGICDFLFGNSKEQTGTSLFCYALAYVRPQRI